VRPLSFRPRVELLEARTVPTVFTVDTAAMTLAPDGQVSLWEAIAAANTNAPFGDAPAGSPGLDTIRFAHSLNGQTIVYPASVNTEGLSAVEDLTIVGPGAGLLTISGNNTARIFNVNPFSQTGVDVVISGLTLTRGAASSGGGAIRNQGNLTLAGVAVVSNNAISNSEGGGVYNAGTLTITNSTFVGNRATDIFSDGGGGVYNSSGVLTITRSTFAGNSATGGGGVRIFRGTATVTDCTFTGNAASAFGGGLSTDGILTLANSTVAGNTTQNEGGGVHNRGTMTVADSTLAGNTSGRDGGGIINFDTLTVTGSTISGNTAANGFGGGIDDFGILTVTSSTIFGNTAVGIDGGRGGGISAFQDIPKLTSTLVAGNSASRSGPDLDASVSGDSFTLAFCLIQRADGFTFTESAPGTNLFGLDPLLGPFANNGGPTLTRALLPGSPALDRGANPDGRTEDQRGYGYERVVGAAADIGAFESRDPDVRLVPDLLDRSQNVLVVVGTRMADAIGLRRDDADVEVVVNRKVYNFDANAVGRIVAFGMEGNDRITSALAIGTLLDGGRGADTLTGGTTADVLIGGAGADVLSGGRGRDVLIGGDGIDRLTGGADDDLLVGGRTAYDQDHRALTGILAAWTADDSYDTRAANLAAGTDIPPLGAAQITDGFADMFVCDPGLELLYAGPGDRIQGRTAGESLVTLNAP
jgi:RTX calcium-binding nonapeptide repeat (4 copies)